MVDVIGERGGGRTAAALDQTLNQELITEAQARARLTGLVDRRNDLLVDGDDAEVDAVEVEIAIVTRQLDRLELRIPALRQRHAEALAAEQLEAHEGRFEAAVLARLKAAGDVDAALAMLGRAHRAFEAAGRQIEQTGAPLGSEGYRRVRAALRLHADAFERAIGAPAELLLVGQALQATERAAWARVRDAGGIHAVAPARAPHERRPSLGPITAEQLQRDGRYGTVTLGEVA